MTLCFPQTSIYVLFFLLEVRRWSHLSDVAHHVMSSHSHRVVPQKKWPYMVPKRKQNPKVSGMYARFFQGMLFEGFWLTTLLSTAANHCNHQQTLENRAAHCSPKKGATPTCARRIRATYNSLANGNRLCSAKDGGTPEITRRNHELQQNHFQLGI